MSKFSQRFFLLRAVSPILGLYAQFGRMGYQRLMPVLAERFGSGWGRTRFRRWGHYRLDDGTTDDGEFHRDVASQYFLRLF